MSRKRDYKSESFIRRLATKAWYDSILKTLSCTHCGSTDFRTFEWHHTDPNQKDMHVSRMLSRKSKAAILAEIQKCICLCANCHRILHYREKGKIRKTTWNGPTFDV